MTHIPKSLRRAIARVACCVALPAVVAGCGDALPTAGGVRALGIAPARVVLVSVDGLRGDALHHMPRLQALAARGAWTDSMRSVLPSLTVPGHLSMLSGRDVTQWGLRSNALDSTAAMRFVFSGSSTVFDWVRGSGRRTEAIAGAALIGETVVADAQKFFGVDTLIATDIQAAAIAERAEARLTSGAAPALLFVHFPDVDLAGHDSGWVVPGASAARGGDSLGTYYLDAARRVDAAIGRLADALAPALDSGTVALVVTADHGGGHGEGCVTDVPAFREHCTAAPGDELIPFVLVARGLQPQRLTSGARLTQVGPTVGALLRAWVPGTADGAVTIR